MKHKLQNVGKLYEGLPYFAMLCGLALVYIANVHNAEKKIRKIDAAHKKIEEIKRDYIHVKARSVDNGRLFEVAKEMNGLDVTKEIRIPKKIEKLSAKV